MGTRRSSSGITTRRGHVTTRHTHCVWPAASLLGAPNKVARAPAGCEAQERHALGPRRPAAHQTQRTPRHVRAEARLRGMSHGLMYTKSERLNEYSARAVGHRPRPAVTITARSRGIGPIISVSISASVSGLQRCDCEPTFSRFRAVLQLDAAALCTPRQLTAIRGSTPPYAAAPLPFVTALCRARRYIEAAVCRSRTLSAHRGSTLRLAAAHRGIRAPIAEPS